MYFHVPACYAEVLYIDVWTMFWCGMLGVLGLCAGERGDSVSFPPVGEKKEY